MSIKFNCLQVLRGLKKWPGCSSTTWTTKLLRTFPRLTGRYSLSKWLLQLVIQYHYDHRHGDLTGKSLPDHYSGWMFHFHKIFIYGVHNTQILYSCRTTVIYSGTGILPGNKLYLHQKDQIINLILRQESVLVVGIMRNI